VERNSAGLARLAAYDSSMSGAAWPRANEVIEPCVVTGLGKARPKVTKEDGERPHVFICGPSPLVEAAAAALVELGHDPTLVKTERFGPTGGSARASSDDRKD
jgi:ferredoxin-NADP reductase